MGGEEEEEGNGEAFLQSNSRVVGRIGGEVVRDVHAVLGRRARHGDQQHSHAAEHNRGGKRPEEARRGEKRPEEGTSNGQ